MSNDWQQDPSSAPDGSFRDPASGSTQPEPNYGQPQPGHQPPVHQPRSKPKLENEDVIAMVLSFFLPGLGQLMLGQQTKGIVMIGISLVSCAGFGLLTIASVVDAYCLAMARKRRIVDDWEFFPDINELF